jgi:hypothetical protein
MSSFELGFDMGKKSSLYAAMFLENGYGTILDQNKNESYIGYSPSLQLIGKPMACIVLIKMLK